MAGDSSVVGLAKVDPSKIGSLLGNLDMTGSITLTTNFSEVLSGLGDIKAQLNELKNPVEINLQINPAVKSELADITNQLTNVNNLTGNVGKGSNQRANQTGKGSTRAIPLSKLSNRVGLKKYKEAMQQEVNTFAKSIGDKGGKLLRTRVAFDPKSKEYRGIVEYQNELGKTTKAVLALNKADGVYRVASEEVTTNYQAQANALQASNKQLEQQKKLYEDMRSRTQGQYGLTGDYADKANEQLQKYKDAIDAIKITQDDVNSGKVQQQLQDLQDLGKATSDVVKQQEALQKDSLSASAYNTRYLARNNSAIDTLYSQAFNQKNPLTGEFRTKAETEIQAVRDALGELDQAGGKFTADQESNISALMIKAKNTIKEQKDAQYGATDLAAKDISQGLVQREANDLEKAQVGFDQIKSKLQEAGIETQQFQERFDSLRESISGVKDVNGNQSWLDSFKTLTSDISAAETQMKAFQQSVEGQSLALAKSIDTKQLQEVAQLTDKMTNLPKGMEGTAADSLREKLKGIGDGYREITDQLKAGNLDQGQFDNIKQKVSDLDTQLKEASSSAKMFEEGFKFDKYQLDVEQLGQKFDRLKQKYQDFVNANPEKANGDIEQKLETLGQHVQSLDGNFDPEKLKLYNAELRNTATAVNNVVNPTQSLSQMLSQNFGAVGQYLSRFTSGMFLITKGVQTVKSMVNEVKSLDTSMMELQKVTNLSGNSMSSFADQAYSVGAELGRTGKDVMDAVTTFSRAGYNLDESTELAKSALVMSNVGVDIPNMESAASDMISIMKAFDIEAQDSMSVIDKLYSVANKEPLDFGNITSMLVTAGGTLAQSNTSLEETMGLLTGGFATLRDNSVANG